MLLIKILYFSFLFILLYSYVGYGALAWLLVKLKMGRRDNSTQGSAFVPPVTLVIAAYNESGFIEEKIKNTLELDYPEKQLEILFITDGSTDSTPDQVRKYSRVRLMHEPARKGKPAAINRAMKTVQTPFVIFCDANTILNKDAIRKIVNHYKDEKTGGVSGEKKVFSQSGRDAAGTEGIYWKYESALKKLDASLYTVVGAAGELFSIRTSLFQPVESDIILDDFIISMRINMQGYRIAYAPDAYATEAPSASISEEYKRKVRIGAGGFQSIVRLAGLLNVFKYKMLSFQYISHRFLRWAMCPFGLLIVLISNIFLVYENAGKGYTYMLTAQIIFYLLAASGYILAARNIKIRACYIPFYFVFMNIAILQGFFKQVRKQQSAVWDKAERELILDIRK